MIVALNRQQQQSVDIWTDQLHRIINEESMWLPVWLSEEEAIVCCISAIRKVYQIAGKASQ